MYSFGTWPGKKSSARSAHGTKAGAPAADAPTSHGGCETTKGATTPYRRAERSVTE